MEPAAWPQLRVHLATLGLKHPESRAVAEQAQHAPATLVLDVRDVPHPREFLRSQKFITGLDQRLRAALMDVPQARARFDELCARVNALLDGLRGSYATEAHVFVGCKSGMHRSVSFVELLREYLVGTRAGLDVTVHHRELERMAKRREQQREQHAGPGPAPSPDRHGFIHPSRLANMGYAAPPLPPPPPPSARAFANATRHGHAPPPWSQARHAPPMYGYAPPPPQQHYGEAWHADPGYGYAPYGHGYTLHEHGHEHGYAPHEHGFVPHEHTHGQPAYPSPDRHGHIHPSRLEQLGYAPPAWHAPAGWPEPYYAQHGPPDQRHVPPLYGGYDRPEQVDYGHAPHGLRPPVHYSTMPSTLEPARPAEQHKPHQRRRREHAATSARRNSTSSTSSTGSTGSVSVSTSSSAGTSSGVVMCPVCQTAVSVGQLNEHVKGKRHQNRAATHQHDAPAPAQPARLAAAHASTNGSNGTNGGNGAKLAKLAKV